MGKLLEDLDSFAGNIAFLHCDRGPDAPLPVLVTASVDAIELRDRLSLDEILHASGQVVYTGRSSLDLRMQLTQVRLSNGLSAGNRRLALVLCKRVLSEQHRPHQAGQCLCRACAQPRHCPRRQCWQRSARQPFKKPTAAGQR